MNSKYNVSNAFHEKCKDLLDHLVTVTLRDGKTIEGSFADEFYEDESILISPVGNSVHIIKIADIERVTLLPEE